MQVVVDLFAGIGYFTVPLLALPPRCKKLFACEINPDSVFALQQNLLRNGVVRLEGCILVKLIVARHIACELIGFVAAWVLGGSMHSACRGQCRFRFVVLEFVWLFLTPKPPSYLTFLNLCLSQVLGFCEALQIAYC